MTADEFQKVLEDTIGQVEDILGKKAVEYANNDRLQNFKKVSNLCKITPEQALAGMMAKHTVSIYDMIMSNEHFSGEKWDEKIVDHINYLILLKALIIEKVTNSDKG